MCYNIKTIFYRITIILFLTPDKSYAEDQFKAHFLINTNGNYSISFTKRCFCQF